MSITATRMHHPDAVKLANRFIETYCPQGSVIAGSLRRGKETVGDIEILAPLPENGAPDELYDRLAEVTDVPPKKKSPSLFDDAPPSGKSVFFAIKGFNRGFRYCQLAPDRQGGAWGKNPPRTRFDIFRFEPGPEGNFGLISIIRTGPWEFSQAFVMHAAEIGWKVEKGQLWNPAGERVSTPDERGVFDALGLKWVEPHCRRWRGQIEAV